MHLLCLIVQTSIINFVLMFMVKTALCHMRTKRATITSAQCRTARDRNRTYSVSTAWGRRIHTGLKESESMNINIYDSKCTAISKQPLSTCIYSAYMWHLHVFIGGNGRAITGSTM